MSKLESVLINIRRQPAGSGGTVPDIALGAFTFLYLGLVLSVPLYEPQRLVWLAVYPVVYSEVSGYGLGSLIKRSQWILPVVLLVGIFNPWIERQTAFYIGNIAVSRGWVSFVSLSLRGLLSFQAALLMINQIGVHSFCRILRRFGLPRVVCAQILFTHRYISVIMEEALWLDRARKARGFGKESYPLPQWGRMIGQLLVRSYERSLRIHRAMLARGFEGTVPFGTIGASRKSNLRGWIFFIAWSGIAIALRFMNFGFSLPGISS